MIFLERERECSKVGCNNTDKIYTPIFTLKGKHPHIPDVPVEIAICVCEEHKRFMIDSLMDDWIANTVPPSIRRNTDFTKTTVQWMEVVL